MESTLCWPGQLSEKDVLVGEQSSGFGDQVCDLIQFFGLMTVCYFFLILQAGGILQILQSDSFWSGQFFMILPANLGGIVGSFIHKFVCCL